MSQNLNILNFRLNNAIKNCCTPGTGFYDKKEQRDLELSRIEALVQEIAPDKIGEWSSFKEELEGYIQLDQKIRTLSSQKASTINELDSLSILEQTSPELSKSIQSLKAVWETHKQEHPEPPKLQEMIKWRAESFKEQITRATSPPPTPAPPPAPASFWELANSSTQRMAASISQGAINLIPTSVRNFIFSEKTIFIYPFDKPPIPVQLSKAELQTIRDSQTENPYYRIYPELLEKGISLGEHLTAIEKARASGILTTEESRMLSHLILSSCAEDRNRIVSSLSPEENGRRISRLEAEAPALYEQMTSMVRSNLDENARNLSFATQVLFLSIVKARYTRALTSLIFNVARGEYGEKIKEAFLDSNPAVVSWPSLMKFVFLEGLRSFQDPQPLLELNNSEESQQITDQLFQVLQEDPLTSEELERLFLEEGKPIFRGNTNITERLNDLAKNMPYSLDLEHPERRDLEQVVMLWLPNLSKLNEAMEHQKGENAKSPLSQAELRLENMETFISINRCFSQENAEFVLEKIEQVETSKQEALYQRLLNTFTQYPYFLDPNSKMGEFLMERLAKASSPTEKQSIRLGLYRSLFLLKREDALSMLQDILSTAASENLEISLFDALSILYLMHQNKVVHPLTRQVLPLIPLNNRMQYMYELAKTLNTNPFQLSQEEILEGYRSILSEIAQMISHHPEVIPQITSFPFPSDLKNDLKNAADGILSTLENPESKLEFTIFLMDMFTSVDKTIVLHFAKSAIPLYVNMPESAFKNRDTPYTKLGQQFYQRAKFGEDPADKDWLDACIQLNEKVLAQDFEQSCSLFLEDLRDVASVNLYYAENIAPRILNHIRTHLETPSETNQEYIGYLKELSEIPELASFPVMLKIKEALKKEQEKFIRLKQEELAALTDPISQAEAYEKIISFCLSMDHKKTKALEFGTKSIKVLQEITDPSTRHRLRLPILFLFAPFPDNKSEKLCMDLIKSEPFANYRAEYFKLLAEARPNQREALEKKAAKEAEKWPRVDNEF